jgi:hypothetical protein
MAFAFPNLRVATDGTFRGDGVGPGRYRLTVLPPSGNVWTVRSGACGERDILDAPFEIVSGRNVDDCVFTLTDRPTELTGTLQDVSGRPAPDYFIVVFATDRARWVPQSRWIAQTRPSTDGAFTVKGLPAGEYYVAAVTDVQPGEWFSPSFLEPMATPDALKVVLVDGQRTVQNLRIAGGDVGSDGHPHGPLGESPADSQVLRPLLTLRK